MATPKELQEKFWQTRLEVIAAYKTYLKAKGTDFVADAWLHYCNVKDIYAAADEAMFEWEFKQ